LNDRQIDLIARALPKRDYYLSSRAGSRLFDLDLGPIALALCASATPAHQKQMDEILGSISDPKSFMPRWLALHDLGWAAELVHGSPQHSDLLVNPERKAA
jgi:type IV secretion system protein TrbE